MEHRAKIYFQEVGDGNDTRDNTKSGNVMCGLPTSGDVVGKSPTVAVTPRRYRAGEGAGELRVWAEAGHVDGARAVQGRLAKGCNLTLNKTQV